jgi:hypothetical protein
MARLSEWIPELVAIEMLASTTRYAQGVEVKRMSRLSSGPSEEPLPVMCGILGRPAPNDHISLIATGWAAPNKEFIRVREIWRKVTVGELAGAAAASWLIRRPLFAPNRDAYRTRLFLESFTRKLSRPRRLREGDAIAVQEARNETPFDGETPFLRGVAIGRNHDIPQILRRGHDAGDSAVLIEKGGARTP